MGTYAVVQKNEKCNATVRRVLIIENGSALRAARLGKPQTTPLHDVYVDVDVSQSTRNFPVTFNYSRERYKIPGKNSSRGVPVGRE